MAALVALGLDPEEAASAPSPGPNGRCEFDLLARLVRAALAASRLTPDGSSGASAPRRCVAPCPLAEPEGLIWAIIPPGGSPCAIPLLVALALAASLAAGRVAADAAGRRSRRPTPRRRSRRSSPRSTSAHDRAKDDAKLSSAAKRAPALYKSTTEQAMRGALAEGARRGSSSSRSSPRPGARRSRRWSRPRTRRRPGRSCRRSIPKDDVEDTERFNVRDRQGGRRPPARCGDRHAPRDVKKAKQAELAAEAASALGKYHTSKQRVRVLEEIVQARQDDGPEQRQAEEPEPRGRRPDGARSRPRSARRSTR